MTRSQFIDLTLNVMQRRNSKTGLWTIFFYPKSTHLVVHTDFQNRVYPLLALSENYEYYKWIYGPKLVHDWINFAKIITKIFYGYVFFTGKSLRAVDIKNGAIVEADITVGGGRFYEPLACPYKVFGMDVVVT